jgi:hypothetical protein
VLDEKLEDIPYCADSCGRAATTERLVGPIGETSDFSELVELVCVHCLEVAA